MAAVFFENTVGSTVKDCIFERNDGIAVMFSGHATLSSPLAFARGQPLSSARHAGRGERRCAQGSHGRNGPAGTIVSAASRARSLSGTARRPSPAGGAWQCNGRRSPCTREQTYLACSLERTLASATHAGGGDGAARPCFSKLYGQYGRDKRRAATRDGHRQQPLPRARPVNPFAAFAIGGE